MDIPDFVVVLASDKQINDPDVDCRKVSISSKASQYNYALTGKSRRGWSKLRWLYLNRTKLGFMVRWMVLDGNLRTALAVNRGPRRGTDGPDWAAIAIDQVAFEVYRTYSVSGGLPSLGKRR